MPLLQSQMLLNDGKYYKWAAKADHDNPYYRSGADHSELNRTEGYEVLYFINHLVAKKWRQADIGVYQQIERKIKAAPPTTRTHKGIEDWIIATWNSK